MARRRRLIHLSELPGRNDEARRRIQRSANPRLEGLHTGNSSSLGDGTPLPLSGGEKISGTAPTCMSSLVYALSSHPVRQQRGRPLRLFRRRRYERYVDVWLGRPALRTWGQFRARGSSTSASFLSLDE